MDMSMELAQKKIIVTGGSGRLGQALKKVFPEALFPTHDEMDITDREAVLRYFSKWSLHTLTVIHAAAATGVKRCEENREWAWKTNVIGTRNIANALKRSLYKNLSGTYDKQLIYVSTACVFHGDDKGYYTEESLPYPKNFYALTKLLGEFEALRLPYSLILRTNFVADKPWEHPKAFCDRSGTYLFAIDVAKAIKEVIGTNGVVHIVGDKEFTMFELAQYLSPDVKPCTMLEMHMPYLTRNMTLDTVRWKKYQISLKGRKRIAPPT